MTIEKKMNGNELVIALEGRLDTMTSPELEAELNQSLAGADSLTLDFSKLEYISSAGKSKAGLFGLSWPISLMRCWVR